MSRIHVVFEINPATQQILLSVRSKRTASVRFDVLPPPPKPSASPNKTWEETNVDHVERGAHLETIYGQDYTIYVAAYSFKLRWRRDIDTDSLKALAIQGYQASTEKLKLIRSRDRATENDASEALSWHITRLRTAKQPTSQDIGHLRRNVGEGAFGVVVEAVDRKQGFLFAIKIVNLQASADIERARAMLHREVKVMERLQHDNIIEYLGCQHFDTLHPEILMPLRDGCLASLVKSQPSVSRMDICNTVLEQILGALDYLANQDLIHRDVKPENILYTKKMRTTTTFN